MQSENPLLDQIAKLVTNAAGAAKGVRDEIGAVVKTQAERLVNDLDLVPREEFEALKSLAQISRTEVERLRARLARLELATSSPVKKMIHSKRNAPIRRRSPSTKYRR